MVDDTIARQRAEAVAAAAEQEREAAAAREHEAAAARDREEAAVRDREEAAAHDDDVARALVLHEAAAIANLHAQAVAVQNIRALVLVVLDLGSPNYNKWCGRFLITLGKYSLTSHVLSNIVRRDSADWSRMDCVVLEWLYGTITPDLCEIVMENGVTAHAVWRALEGQFIVNRETRALHLDAEFRAFVQGDLTISDYCRRLKSMADALGDLGEPVLDRTLVLAVLRGLNEKFAYMSALLKRQRPFPTFLEVRSDLLLEELEMASRPSQQTTTVLLATAPSGAKGGAQPASGQATALGGRSTAPPVVTHGATSSSCRSSSANRRRRRNNRDGNNNGGGKSGTTGAPSGWPSFYNPWTGTIQMWPGPQQSAGARPPGASMPQSRGGVPMPHAMVAMTAPAYYSLPPQVPLSAPAPPASTPMSGPGTWDQMSLANAFNTMTLTPPPNTDWYMDSGASAHMTSDAGNLSPSFPPKSLTPSSIVVGDGSLLPVTSTGFTNLHDHLRLNNVLVASNIIKNLISVR